MLMNNLFELLPNRESDVLLVVPPFAGIERPSLGVHQLQAVAKEDGISVDVFYANIFFASLIGVDTYNRIVNSPYAYHVGERLFAKHAFGTGGVATLIDNYHDLHSNEDPLAKIEEFKETLGKLKPIEERLPAYIENIAQLIVASEYKYIGFTTTFQQVASSISIANELKSSQPDLCILFGGGNCESDMGREMLKLTDSIDYVFAGESEASFLHFIAEALEGNRPPNNVIQGSPCKNLNKLPIVNYHDYYAQIEHWLDDEVYLDTSLMYETSRGCWWGQKHHCTFCGLGETMSFREKDALKVVAELKQLLDQHPNSNIFMVDNIIPHTYFETLLPLLEKEVPDANIFYELKSNLTLEKCIQLKNAGVNIAQPGIEALSTSLLRRMDKGVTASQNINLLRYSRSVKMVMTWNLLYGFPGDTKEEYEETLYLLPFLRHFFPPAGPFKLSLDRFSPYYDFPEKYGITNRRPIKGYRGLYPETIELPKMAYHFEGDYESASCENSGLIADIQREVDIWEAMWNEGSDKIPRLHVKKMFNGRLALIDTRGLSGTQDFQFIDQAQAEVLLANTVSEDHPLAHWALENKLAVQLDKKVLPLATANPSLFIHHRKEAVESTELTNITA
jgi:ribosomal peptide maturation radical SAM protein 1